MRKNGFSLSEVIIALSIIGIAAAIAMPAISKARPDKYKMRVLNCYKTIGEVTSNLLNNDSIYFRKSVAGATSSDFNDDGTPKSSTQYGCNGLFCTEMPYDGSGYNTTDYKGVCKYPNLMISLLQLDDTTKCNGNNTIKAASGNMPDGTTWEIRAEGTSAANGYKITIDMDSSNNSPNHEYHKTNYKNPDRFIFFVDSDGDVKAHTSDKLTEVYLDNMTRNDRKADFDEAANK